jgi:hypothetical protein
VWFVSAEAPPALDKLSEAEEEDLAGRIIYQLSPELTIP